MNREDFCIVIDGKKTYLIPENDEEFKELCGALINIVGVTSLNVANAQKGGDKVKVEHIMKFCGQLSGDAAKYAISLYAKEHPQVKLEDTEVRGDA